MSTMKNEYNIKQWIEKFDNGNFDKSDRETQIEAGWYDWFCDDEELRDRLYKMAHIVKELSNSPRLNIEAMNVSFKNNCPIAFPLYDSIRFSKGMDINDVVYWIDIDSGHEKHKFAIYENKSSLINGCKAIFGCNAEEELIKWFNF